MRYLNIFFFILMILFMAVQYNDPDGPKWVAIYSIPAIWNAIAAFKNPLLEKPISQTLMLISLFAAIVAVIYFWPDTPNWWQQDVWWETETAREGMGMMIVILALIAAWISRPRKRRHG